MLTRLMNFWDRLRASFWFVPSIMTSFAIALAIILPMVDAQLQRSFGPQVEFLTMTADSARGILSSIAGAMATVTGVVFSIAIVTLSVASTQFGPRLLRTFMRNATTHFALGMFVSASIYSLVLLSAIRDVGDIHFVPGISVFVAVLIAIMALAVLVYFFHNIAQLIQAPNVVRAVANDLNDSIDRLYPQGLGESPRSPEHELEMRQRFESLGDDKEFICSKREGYLQAVDLGNLLQMATKNGVILQLHVEPGDFVAQSSHIASIWPTAKYSKELEEQIDKLFIVGNRPTPRQDIESAVNELVELAVRSLSPSLNDPFTAWTCIDYLGATLSRLVTREVSSQFRVDEEDQLRIVVRRPEFPHVLRTAFHQIRHYGRTTPTVLAHILEALCLIAISAQRDEDKQALMVEAQLVKRAAEQHIDEEEDRQPIYVRYARFLESINAQGPHRNLQTDNPASS